MKMPADLQRRIDRGEIKIRYERTNLAAEELERMADKLQQEAGKRTGIGYWVGMNEAAAMCRRRAKTLRRDQAKR
jgi:hypothetical protein